MSKAIGEGTLAGAEGYLVYDDIHNQLCDIFYGTAGIDDPESYISQYMMSTYGVGHNDAKKLFLKNRNTNTEAATAAFEADVRSGKVQIVVETASGNVQVLNLDEFNHDYNKPSGAKTVEGEEVFNGVVTVFQDENVLLIEGSNSEKNPSDWDENIDMADNFLVSGSTPDVYKDGYKYFQEYNASVGADDKVTKIVGNSQGGGTAVYIGMQDSSVEVLALNPAPQYSKDVDANGNYTNITIVYTSGDPLYNLTAGVGFTTEIPGANIVHVDFGLDKGFASSGIASADIHAAHTGSISAVDYNEDGKIDEFEQNLGLEVDDVIPRSAFTGKELGTGYKNDKGIVMSSEHMSNFAEYLRVLRERDLADVIDRNKAAYSRNEEKIENRDYEYKFCCRRLFDDTETNVVRLIPVLDGFLEFIDDLESVSERFKVNFGAMSNNGFKLPKTEGFLEGISKVLKNYKAETVLVIGKKRWEYSENTIDFINNRSGFLKNFDEDLSMLLKKYLSLELVPHSGDHAIGYTLKGILDTLNKESEKIVRASANLEDCSRYIGERFESVDKAIAEGINQKYLSGSLTDSEEKVYESQEEYITSLELVDAMTVIEQYEELVSLCCEEVMTLIKTLIEHLLMIGDIILNNKSYIYDILDYEGVYAELENARNPLYGKDISTGVITDVLLTTVIESNEFYHIADATANSVIDTIEDTFRPKSFFLEKLENNIVELESIMSDAEQFAATLLNYLEPHIETLIYDTIELDVVRDTITLNAQLLSRVDTEISSAYDTLSGQVEFLGKDAMQELVKELKLRVDALMKLHYDIFGDGPPTLGGGSF